MSSHFVNGLHLVGLPIFQMNQPWLVDKEGGRVYHPGTGQPEDRSGSHLGNFVDEVRTP